MDESTVESHRLRRLVALERSTQAHLKAATVHERAASFFDGRGDLAAAARHRGEADKARVMARDDRDRAEAARRHLTAAEVRLGDEQARTKAAGERDLAAARRATAMGDGRGLTLDDREQVADERDRIADVRDRLADQRDGIADERGWTADQREVAADNRELLAERHEREQRSFVDQVLEFRLRAAEICERLADGAVSFADYLDGRAIDGETPRRQYIAEQERRLADVARGNATRLRGSGTHLPQLEPLPRLNPEG